MFSSETITSSRIVCVCRVVSEDDFEGSRKEGVSDDELFEPYSDTRWVQFFLGIIINLSEQDKKHQLTETQMLN